MVTNRVAGCAASRRASVDFPAAIFPQTRYKVVGRMVSIVAEYQQRTIRQLLLRVSRHGRLIWPPLFSAVLKNADVNSRLGLRSDVPKTGRSRNARPNGDISIVMFRLGTREVGRRSGPPAEQ